MATITPHSPLTTSGDPLYNAGDDSRQREPLVLGNNDFTTVTDKVTGLALNKPPLGWYIGMAISLSLLDRKSTRLNFSHSSVSRMPSSA